MGRNNRRPDAVYWLSIPAHERAHSKDLKPRRDPLMTHSSTLRRFRTLVILMAGLTAGSLAYADDMVSFATGGYARGLRTMAEMHKIDTDGDGTVSKTEWLAYQDKVWTALDQDKAGTIDEKTFLAPSPEMASFATGGYARGLKTKAMMHRIDADGDGTVSHEEFIAYQTKIFEMMDHGHSGSLGPQEFLGK
jgi:hypothetical protein